MRLTQRAISSVSWKLTASVVSSGVMFVRSILLARLLPVKTFGVYGFATAIVGISMTLVNFGMDGAFIHRSPETEDESQTAATHFTLRIIFTIFWLFVIFPLSLYITGGDRRVALQALILINAGRFILQTPILILTRRVVHRRLALITLVNSILTSLVAVVLAWKGVVLWALLATDITALVMTFVLLYIWRPVWRPSLLWSSERVRYFLSFGSRNMVAGFLQKAIDEVDDLWTGSFLGDMQLGFYSRAYTFATYPRRVLATPIVSVATGTYAELKGNRKRLSRAFFQINSLLIRTGFLFGGLLTLVAPEFIRLVIDPKWLPMVTTFRLMLVFTLLSPISATVGNLFVAVGRPEILMRTRLYQMAILILGLFTFGNMWGIEGVALAIDVMLLAGILFMFYRAIDYVDIDLKNLFLVPVIAITVAILIALLGLRMMSFVTTDWHTGGVKLILFSLIYIGIILVVEFREILELYEMVANILFGSLVKEG
jgi:O-antigen/teichoic acid export membrane protein